MKLVYFKTLRGLGEMVRLAMAAGGIDFEEEAVDYQAMKTNLDEYPFAQCPKLIDGELEIVQSNAIMRHIGRKYGLYGSTEADAVAIDTMMDGIVALRSKYLHLIYTDQLADDKKAEHWQLHGSPESTGSRNGGAHLTYLSNLLKRNAADGRGFVSGSNVSIADCILFDIVELYVRIFEGEMKATYPELMAYHAFVSEQKGIKEYIASGKRPEKINGNNLG